MAGDPTPFGIRRFQFDAAALHEDSVGGGLERFVVDVRGDGEFEAAAGPGDRDVIAARGLEVGEVDLVDVFAEELVFAPGSVPRRFQGGFAGKDDVVCGRVADFERRGSVIPQCALGELVVGDAGRLQGVLVRARGGVLCGIVRLLVRVILLCACPGRPEKYLVGGDVAELLLVAFDGQHGLFIGERPHPASDRGGLHGRGDVADLIDLDRVGVGAFVGEPDRCGVRPGDDRRIDLHAQDVALFQRSVDSEEDFVLEQDRERPPHGDVEVDDAAASHGLDVGFGSIDRDTVVLEQESGRGRERGAELQADDAVADAVEPAKPEHGQSAEFGRMLHVRDFREVGRVVFELISGPSRGNHVGTVAQRDDGIRAAGFHGRVKLQIGGVTTEL